MANYLDIYVTASLVKKTFTEDYPEGLHAPRQGVLVKDNGDGTILLQGERGAYLYFDTGIVIVPDRNLFGKTKRFVLEQRKLLEQTDSCI